MIKINKQLSFVFLFLSVAWFAQAQHEHAGEVLTQEVIHAKKVEADNALHLGTKGTKYKERYTLQIDLSKIDSVEPYADHTKMPSELSIEQRDEIFSKLGDALPAGSDFAIWISTYKKGNIASVMFALPKGADDIDFDGVDLVLTAGPPAEQYGFYLGDPDRPIHYSRIKGWTKEDGLKAINKALESGATADVETTIFFRDKHDFALRNKNPYREVMTYLLDGDTSGNAYVEGFTNQASFALKVRPDQVEYIRDHPLVSNVVPNLPLPKNK